MGISAVQYRAAVGMFLPRAGGRKARRRRERETARGSRSSRREGVRTEMLWERSRIRVTDIMLDFMMTVMWISLVIAGTRLTATLAESGMVPGGGGLCTGGVLLRTEGCTDA